MILGHSGITWVFDTIEARFHSEILPVHYKHYVYPKNIHMYKQQGRWYGKLPLCHVETALWNKVYTDLIGTWEIKVNSNICKFVVLKCIDPITNLVELINEIYKQMMGHVTEQFKNAWLSR